MELIAVTVGGISLYTYGLITLGAILLGLLAACGNFRLHGEDVWRMEDLLIWSLPLSLVIGRLLYVVSNWNEFRFAPHTAFYLWHGGISCYAVIPVVFFTVYAYCQIHGFNAWRWMDLLLPAVLLAISLHDLGASLQMGGTMSSSPIGLSDSDASYIDFRFHPFDVQGAGDFHTVLLHRAGLEGLAFLLIAALTLWQRRRLPWKNGSIALLGIGLFFLIRFFFEFF